MAEVVLGNFPVDKSRLVSLAAPRRGREEGSDGEEGRGRRKLRRGGADQTLDRSLRRRGSWRRRRRSAEEEVTEAAEEHAEELAPSEAVEGCHRRRAHPSWPN